MYKSHNLQEITYLKVMFNTNISKVSSGYERKITSTVKIKLKGLFISDIGINCLQTR